MNYIILSILSLALGFYLGRRSREGELVGLGKINAESKTQKEERKARRKVKELLDEAKRKVEEMIENKN